MKRIFFITAFGMSILSCIFLSSLFCLLLFPVSSIKIMNQYAVTSYTIDFYNIENSGNIFHQNLKFFDVHVRQNDRSILQLKELGLGISFKPQNFFKPFNIRTINIKDGYYNHTDFSSSNSFFANFMNFNESSSLTFKNFKYKKYDSAIIINGDLFGKFPKSLNGQLSFLHDDNLSTLAFNLSANSYRFLINLHSYKWLSLIPKYNVLPFKDLAFKLNAVGNLEENQSFIKGSFEHSDLSFQSLNVKQNQGSFVFQSNQEIGSLILTKFLHPFVDEEDPVQINLSKKSIAFPKFFITPQTIETNSLKFTNLSVENLFLSFKNVTPQYSGFIKDLDLKDLYFAEILNLGGEFSGQGRNFKFTINSKNSILKNDKKNFVPVSIIGGGNFYNSALNFSGRAINQLSDINFNLRTNSNSIKPSSISLKGSEVMKDFIEFSFPSSLSKYRSYINKNFILGEQNSIYLHYLAPSKNLQGKLKAKIITNDSKLKINENLSINLKSPIIELDDKDLYFFSPSGDALNFSYDASFGLLNFQSQKLRIYSIHDVKSLELRSALGLQDENLNLPSVYAEHKGVVNLSSLKLNNIISAKTKKFNLQIFDSHEINFDQASIFVVDLDKIFGSIPSTYRKQKPLIQLSGAGLKNQYNLTFSTTVNLDSATYIPESSFFKVDGKDNFELDLSIQKNSPPFLRVYSDLKNIKFISPINSLTKNKTKILPTEILITNLFNPSLRLSNQLIDLYIRDFNKYEGYISIGEKLPEKFSDFNKESGLNLYLNLDSMNETFLDFVFSEDTGLSEIEVNKLAFNIKNFQFYNNNFSNISGIFNLINSEVKGNLTADNLNLNLKMDNTGFMRVEMNDSIVSDISFLNFRQPASDFSINSRLIVRNSTFDKLKIKDLDAYILNNKNNFVANNLKLESNLISIKPLNNSSKAYFSINKLQPLSKVRGNFLIKDSNKIPYLGEFADFSYFNGSVNLQWKELSSLSNIEGESNFILKDLLIRDSIANSRAINLLGVLNLRNILGKLANFDLSIDEFTSTKLSRVEGDLLFSKSRMRIVTPLFIETNTAKMKWVGQINKNLQNNLHGLDLNLDLRVKIGENLPWYAAILGGLPAVAGSAVINEIFSEDINNLTNFQYEVLGTISEPQLKRVK